MDKPKPKRPVRPSDPMELAKVIGDIATRQVPKRSEPTEDEVRRVMSSLGKKGGLKGGKARAKKLSKSRREKIARDAAIARWSKLASE